MIEQNKKKKYIIIASICLVLLIVIGATYAYWTTTKVQEDKNVINTDCLRISYTNKSDAAGFTLEKTFPISDADGRALEGYTFTIKNECNTYVNYTVNMESLKLTANGEVSTDDTNSDVKRVDINYINTTLNDGAVLELGGYKTTETLLTKTEGNTATAYDTRELETGALGPNGEGNDSIDYTLRMWLDSETPDSEMNKTYKGKISVWATPTKAENAVKKIIKLTESTPAAASTDSTTQLIEDGTTDNNLRYIGADPANYVDIGNGVYPTDIWVGYNNEDIYKGDYTVEYTSEEECKGNGKYNKHCTQQHKKGDPILWRIIGVMKDNTTDDKQTARLKIIRDEDIGMMTWDARCSTEDETESCSNYDYKNNWNNASLKETLNGAFWNRGITDIRNRVYKYTTENSFKEYWYKLNFEDTGMREISKKLFENAKWHLGGVLSGVNKTATTIIHYNKEHENTIYTGNPPTWEGKVGLMYASDYGFATRGGDTNTRDECLAQSLYEWSNNDYEDCKKNDWLYEPSNSQWLLSPTAFGNNSADYMQKSGFINNYYVNDIYNVRPVLYLKSDVKIVSGNGTKNNPYRLAI